MKKLKTMFSARRIIIYLIILLLVITLPVSNLPAMSRTEAIVTMLCIDRVEDNIVASAIVLAPGQDKQADQQIFSSEASTLGGAVDSLALSLGKEISFAQCDIVAVGDELCEEGIMQSLDFMTRTKKVGRNAILINFSGDIGDFSEAIIALSADKHLKLSDIINYDKRYILAEESNIELFYIGYYSELSLGIMPQIKVSTTKSNNAIEVAMTGADGSSGSSSGGSQSSSQEKKYLINDGTTNIFKNGKSEYILEPDQVKKLNLFLDIDQRGNVTVTNVNDDIYTNASVVIDIIDKKVKCEPTFKDDKPRYDISLELTVGVEEVIDAEPSKDMLRRNQEFLTPALVEKIKEKLSLDMNEMIDFCRETKIDLVDVYKNFYRRQNKKWSKLIEKVGIDNYLDSVEFNIDIKINSQF